MRRCDSPTLTLFQCLQRVKRRTFFWDLHALQSLPACLLAWANGCSLDRTSQTIHQEVVSCELELGNNVFTATPEYLTAFRERGGGIWHFCDSRGHRGQELDGTSPRLTGAVPPLGAPLQSGRCQDTSHLRVVANCNLKFPK